MASNSSFIRYLWLLPFISFLAGYGLMSWWYKPVVLITPSVVGKTVHEAIRVAGSCNLSIQLMGDREEPDLPEGTILQQNPAANASIKPRQPIMCVVSKKRILLAPQCIGQQIAELAPMLDQRGIVYKQFAIDSTQLQGVCIAQDPANDSSLEGTPLTLYIAKQQSIPVIVPRVTYLSVPMVTEFLEQSRVTVDIVHESVQEEGHICTNDCIVRDQRPRAGTIVTLDSQKPLHVQLIVGQ